MARFKESESWTLEGRGRINQKVRRALAQAEEATESGLQQLKSRVKDQEAVTNLLKLVRTSIEENPDPDIFKKYRGDAANLVEEQSTQSPKKILERLIAKELLVRAYAFCERSEDVMTLGSSVYHDLAQSFSDAFYELVHTGDIVAIPQTNHYRLRPDIQAQFKPTS